LGGKSLFLSIHYHRKQNKRSGEEITRKRNTQIYPDEGTLSRFWVLGGGKKAGKKGRNVKGNWPVAKRSGPGTSRVGEKKTENSEGTQGSVLKKAKREKAKEKKPLSGFVLQNSKKFKKLKTH